MTTRDLTPDDVAGFLQMHSQCAEETQFAQLEGEWTPASTLEDVGILLAVFCIVMCSVAGFVLWKVLG